MKDIKRNPFYFIRVHPDETTNVCIALDSESCKMVQSMGMTNYVALSSEHLV